MESETLDIKSILEDLGYKLQDSGPDFWMSKSLDRGNHKSQNLSISKKTGMVLDFSGGAKYSIEEFIKLNNGNYNIDSAQLENFRNINYNDELKLPKVFDRTILDNLIKDYSYWQSRGISKNILEEFRGGLAGDKLPKFNKEHYLTPIFNEKGQIEGFSARYTGNNKYVKKQKLIGAKNNFVFPLFLNKQDILNSRTIYFCEGIGDCLSLFTCGIRNCLVTFGLNLSKKLLSSIIALNPAKIIICENFDENLAGQNGANKIKNKLLEFFDENVVSIVSPAPYNDLNESLTKAGPNFIIELLREKSI